MQKFFTIVFVILLIWLWQDGLKDPCEHLKGQDYHNTAYHNCEYNYLKGL